MPTMPSPVVLSALAFVGIVGLQLILSRLSLTCQETRRRVQHALSGQFLVLVSYLLPLYYCHVLLWTGMILIVYVKFYHDDWYRQAFGGLLREQELAYGALPGAFYFLLGTAMVALLFDEDIARYAVLCLSYADPMAAWMGMWYGNNNKLHSGASVVGCVACFVTALVVGTIMLSGSSLQVRLVGAIACMLAEACFPQTVNDNVVIPLVTAAAVQWSMSFS